MRPARTEDLAAMVKLFAEEVALGRRDAPPNQHWLARMATWFDWQVRARVVDGDQGLTGAVMVGERDTVDGRIARIEVFAFDPHLELELLAWGIEAARERIRADFASVWRGKGHAEGLVENGFECVRPFWRMDRRDLENLVTVEAPAEFDLVTGNEGRLSEEAWVEAYNHSFLDHWHHAPMSIEDWRRRRLGEQPELCLLAVSRDLKLAGVVMCGLEDFEDSRPQPVGIVGSVGTVPDFRRLGLATWLTAEALHRMRGAGAKCASLFVDGESSNRAHALYARLGFEVAFEFDVWERPL
jgi:ribosomal protein S18 acetylase RimI-like enzyme